MNSVTQLLKLALTSLKLVWKGGRWVAMKAAPAIVKGTFTLVKNHPDLVKTVIKMGAGALIYKTVSDKLKKQGYKQGQVDAYENWAKQFKSEEDYKNALEITSDFVEEIKAENEAYQESKKLSNPAKFSNHPTWYAPEQAKITAVAAFNINPLKELANTWAHLNFALDFDNYRLSEATKDAITSAYVAFYARMNLEPRVNNAPDVIEQILQHSAEAYFDYLQLRRGLSSVNIDFHDTRTSKYFYQGSPLLLHARGLFPSKVDYSTDSNIYVVNTLEQQGIESDGDSNSAIFSGTISNYEWDTLVASMMSTLHVSESMTRYCEFYGTQHFVEEKGNDAGYIVTFWDKDLTSEGVTTKDVIDRIKDKIDIIRGLFDADQALRPIITLAGIKSLNIPEQFKRRDSLGMEYLTSPYDDDLSSAIANSYMGYYGTWITAVDDANEEEPYTKQSGWAISTTLESVAGAEYQVFDFNASNQILQDSIPLNVLETYSAGDIASKLKFTALKPTSTYASISRMPGIYALNEIVQSGNKAITNGPAITSWFRGTTGDIIYDIPVNPNSLALNDTAKIFQYHCSTEAKPSGFVDLIDSLGPTGSKTVNAFKRDMQTASKTLVVRDAYTILATMWSNLLTGLANFSEVTKKFRDITEYYGALS